MPSDSMTRATGETPATEEALDLKRAIRDLTFYAKVLCADKPQKYEVYQTADGTEEALSWAVLTVLARLSALEGEVERLTEALGKYGEHDEKCNTNAWYELLSRGKDHNCNCGLDAALHGASSGGTAT